MFTWLHTLVKKEKLLAFSFANFKITRWSTDKQLHCPKKVNSHFFFQIHVEQARSFFFFMGSVCHATKYQDQLILLVLGVSAMPTVPNPLEQRLFNAAPKA